MSDPENAARLEEIPEYYLVSPPTLRELCSQEIAAMACRYSIKNYSGKLDLYDICIMRKDLKIENLLGVDRKFLEKIMQIDIVPHICNSIYFWIYDHEMILGDLEVAVSCLDELVLRPGGDICDLSMTKNLLNGNKLSSLVKYKLACNNCLADQVRSLWPLVSSDPRIYCNDEPLVSYWNSVMKGESEELCRNILKNGRSRILKSSRWPGVEYVFNTIEEDKLVAVAENVFRSAPDDFFERIALKLNRNGGQLHEFMKNINLHIFIIFYGRNTSASAFLKIWNFKKYFIFETEFLYIIEELIRFCHAAEVELLFSILSGMWDSAPNHFKKFVLSDEKKVEWIFHELICFHHDYHVLLTNDYSVDMSFIIAMLADVSLHLRNYIWRKFWTIILFTKPVILDEVMKLCFYNDDEITQFKECEMMNFENIENFCSTLIEKKFVSHLTDYLNFCSTDSKKVSDLAREIITSSSIKYLIRECYINDEGKLKKLAELVRMAFEDPELARNYVRDINSEFNIFTENHKKWPKTM